MRLSQRIRSRYDAVAAKIRTDFAASDYWKALTDLLVEFDSEYRLRDNYPLFMRTGTPDLLVKPYDSFIEKTLRRNCSDNERWPNPPDGGWYLPDNWLERTNDIVRTSIVVKYLDGVRFLAERLDRLAAEHGVRGDLSYEARMEGYYAAHVVIRTEAEVPQENWDTERITARMEIQITTQLQEVIRGLLHRYYEDERISPSARKAWEWDYGGDQFVANYLGHILHYVEGMIMEVRQRQSTNLDTKISA